MGSLVEMLSTENPDNEETEVIVTLNQQPHKKMKYL